MSKLKIIGGIVLVLIIGVVAIGILSGGEEAQAPDIPDETEQTETSVDEPEEEEPEPKPTVNRHEKIPSTQVKMSPKDDYHKPVLHSFLWEDPVILVGGINTAGAEDSPFVSPDGKSFYFFFTPDVTVPAEE